MVQDYLQQEAIELLPWPAMSPDMNPIEHLWDNLEQKVNPPYPKELKYSGIRDCFGSGMATVPSTDRRLIHRMKVWLNLTRGFQKRF